MVLDDIVGWIGFLAIVIVAGIILAALFTGIVLYLTRGHDRTGT
jgi:hypothetical protein